MAWEWSHADEAYRNAYDNTLGQDRGWLEVVYAEWFAHDETCSHGSENFNERKYTEALIQAKGIDTEALADFVWERMSEQRTCTNGGHSAWGCPFGCNCHLVSFDKEE